MPLQNIKPVLFICPTRSTFISVDRQILESAYSVESIYLNQDGTKAGYLWNIARMKIRVLFSRASLVVVWFADYHAAVAILAARISGKKSVVMLGGYDAVSYPELGMGVYTSAPRSLCAKLALRMCTRIIANHESLVSSQNLYYNPAGHPEGVKNLLPGLRTPVDVVYNATPAKAPETLNTPREDVFLCVGTTPRFNDIINKGWDIVVATARRMPDQNFVIVGLDPVWCSEFKRRFHSDELPNLLIHGPLPHAQVLHMMLTSKYFIQPSISEGMPNALMEAMLMGCIPIGSNVAGIPMIIADLGIVFSKRDPQCLKDALLKAMRLQVSPADISASVATRFSMENRAAGILAVLRKL